MNSNHFNAAVEFGRDLIATQDLDPVYTAIHGAELGSKPRAGLFVAYTCLYHLGAAATLALCSDLWQGLHEAALNEGLYWPRGSERRHWRGANALKTVEYLQAWGASPEQVVQYWGTCKPAFNEVAQRVREIPAYGPWIAFKVADMLERVMGYEVDFSNCTLGIYDEPRRSAALILTGDSEAKISDEELTTVVKELLKGLGKVKAPPSFNRIINVAEAETVLCKYKSHVNGHYPLGKDTREVLHGLADKKWSNKITTKMIKVVEALPYASS